MQFDVFASATHQEPLLASHAVISDNDSSTSTPVRGQDALELLQRLAKDDDFRLAMEADPVSAFAQYGFSISREAAPQTVTLPSKEEIEKNIHLLSLKVDATSGWIVFCR